MSREVNLTQDTLDANGMGDDIHPFLQWPVTHVHVDAFTLGLVPGEVGNADFSKNHWTITLQTDYGQVRLSMESRENTRTGQRGLLVLKHLSYSGESMSALFRQTYRWRGPSTVKEVLEYTLDQNWHKFKMHTTLDRAKKGCRYHL